MSGPQLKTVVLTGATGFVGSQLVPLLLDDCEVTAITRQVEQAAGQGCQAVQADLAQDWPTDHLPERADTVIHLAQSSRFRDFPAGAWDVFQVNLATTAKLLDYACRAKAQHFILASSGGVYGYGTGSGAFGEQSPIAPSDALDYYLRTKVSMEMLAASYRQVLNVITLRFFFVYGQGQRQNMLIPRLVNSVRTGQPIRLCGADGLRINPIHVTDAARAVAACLSLRDTHQINVAGPDVRSMRQIGETIGDVLGVEPVFSSDDSVPDQRHLVGDVTKMSELLLAPEIGFRQGVQSLVSRAISDEQ